MRWDVEQLAAAVGREKARLITGEDRAPSGNKFYAVRVQIDTIWFDSKREAERYGELKLLAQGHEIADLKIKPRYRLELNGIYLGIYVADFQYFDNREGKVVVEDVKGYTNPRNPSYRLFLLKARLLEAITGLTVREVKR